MSESPFIKDPILEWSKIMCPVCGECTGKKSKCFQLPPALELEAWQKRFSHPVLGTIPVFSENCAFRNENLWQAEVNYPVSEPLVTLLKNIRGVERVSPVKPYTLQVAIASCFDERSIKAEITRAFKVFIKELHSDWLSLNVVTTTELDKKTVGVELPNGETFVVNKDDKDSIAQLGVVDTLINEIPGAQPIFTKPLEK